MFRRVDYAGFTLFDLLVVVAIAAILLLVGIPSLQSSIQNARMVTTSNGMLGALHLARSEAMKRQTFVTICRSMDQQQCSDDDTREWEHGWIMFVDPDRSGTVNEDNQILRVSGPVPPGITVRSGGNYAQHVSFGLLGVSRGNTGLPNDTLRICDPRGSAHARAVVVNIRGRPRLANGQDAKIKCPS